MTPSSQHLQLDNPHIFICGFRKLLIHLRIVVHVWLHLTGKMCTGAFSPKNYITVLWRALVFLDIIRHNKIVKIGGLYKLQLYVPAYPSRAFFHSLEKFYRPDPGPLTVVYSMTRECSYKCVHCYQKADRGADIPEDLLLQTAVAMQDLGVSMFDIEGGEPIRRFDRLLNLLTSLDHRAELWINTTGADVTENHVIQLKSAGLFGVMISIHHPSAEEHDRFTGIPGSFDVACDAARLFARHGIATAINSCPSGDDVISGRFDDIMRLARDCDCGFVQMIHRKPSGAWLENADASPLSTEVLTRMKAMHICYNSSEFLTMPALSAQAFEEDESVFGCTAGGVDRFYLGADGEVQPCEFLNISFGNVKTESFSTIFARMREHFTTPGTDWLCCTMAGRIAKLKNEHGLRRLPIPWEIVKNDIDHWDKGSPTRLYKRLGIYKEDGDE